ncbi:hypothetical protein [Ktedonosporobacter rubrisoli]|uniref:hypothetical protein n=1 Tax=Ktedonosporobacter rubrisoli TaxID=2509675 RepID=UPI0013EE4D99|nr:hypothetical protein [Ktedonosporobacter rubrisoli]
MEAIEGSFAAGEFMDEQPAQYATKEQTIGHHKRYDALVLDARLRQSLVTIRSLGERGMNVAALEVAPVSTSRENVCRPFLRAGVSMPILRQNMSTIRNHF